MKTIKSSIICLTLLTFTGCVTSGEGKRLREDLFKAQTRILALERKLLEEQKALADKGEVTSRRLADGQATVDRLASAVRRLEGETDMLREAVQRGEIPGTPVGEDSIAKKIEDLQLRLGALEDQQSDLIARMETALASSSKGGATSDSQSSERAPAKNLSQLRQAFEAKRYKHVVTDVGKLLAGAKGKEKEEILYLQAESLYKLGQLRKAALEFNGLLEQKAGKKYTPHAKLRLGDCFRHLNDPETAKLYYSEVVKEFPSSDEAKLASKRMEKL